MNEKCKHIPFDFFITKDYHAFTNREHGDMHFIYGFSNGNNLAVLLGCPRRRTYDLEEPILRFFERNPTASVRRASAHFRTNNTYVWPLFKENGLYPYYFQRVHGMLEGDQAARLHFCRTILGRQQDNHTFISNILLADEACLTRVGVINLHNLHAWCDENPDATVETRNQREFSMNVWASVVADYLLGPIFLVNQLGGVEYLSFLENNLSGLLEEIPLEL